ncbi:MAG TPA: ABC transporter permease [Microbacteriaceae bacterium]|nr:ABC transporter permease [Microbacteriaceae bacterium]
MRSDPTTRTIAVGDREKPGAMIRAWNWVRGRSGAIVLLVILLAIWEAAVRIFNIPSYLLPAPSDAIVALVNGLGSGILLTHTWVTLLEIMGGFAIAVLTAFVLAFAVTKWRWVEKSVLPLVFALQSVPKVALAPLILTWFGFGITSKLVTVALVAFFPLVVNLIAGIQSADSDRVDMFKALGASEWTIFRKLRLPNATPYIMAGLDIAIVFCIIGAIVAEFVGAQAGLGYLIQASAINLDVSMTFAILIILSALGLVLHAILTVISRRVVFWQGKGLEAITER